MIGKRLRNITQQLLLIFYILKKKICPAVTSKIDSNCEKQIIVLMIPNEEKEGWHYLAVQKLSALLHGITSKHRGDFYCLNCLHSFRTKNKLKSHEKVCENKDFCGIVTLSEKDNILKFNQYMKSDKMPYITYADIESLIKKIDRCANNPENYSTTKIVEYIPCGYSMSTVWASDNIENNYTLCRGEDCTKMLCTSLREHGKI